MSDYKTGDMVKLRSHPQKLMVEAQNGPLKLICVWIDDYGQPHREQYRSEILDLYPDEDPYKKEILEAVKKREEQDKEKPEDNIPF